MFYIPKRILLIATGALLCLQGLVLAGEDGERDGTGRYLAPKEFESEAEDVFSGKAADRLQGERPERGTRGKSGAASNATDEEPTPSRFAWSKLISPETVVDEIKAARLDLAEHVKSPSAYKSGGYREARLRFSVIAVMFGVAAEYDQPIRFSRQAPAARDAMAAAGRVAKVADDKSYKLAKRSAEELDELVRGGRIEFDAAKQDVLWHELADRPQLMKRFELALDERIRPWMADRGEMMRHQSELLHETEIVAALAEVIQREEYEFYDDEDYLELCRTLSRNALSARSAVRERDLGRLQEAVGGMMKACSACHEDYR